MLRNGPHYGVDPTDALRWEKGAPGYSTGEGQKKSKFVIRFSLRHKLCVGERL